MSFCFINLSVLIYKMETIIWIYKIMGEVNKIKWLAQWWMHNKLIINGSDSHSIRVKPALMWSHYPALSATLGVSGSASTTPYSRPDTDPCSMHSTVSQWKTTPQRADFLMLVDCCASACLLIRITLGKWPPYALPLHYIKCWHI